MINRGNILGGMYSYIFKDLFHAFSVYSYRDWLFLYYKRGFKLDLKI